MKYSVVKQFSNVAIDNAYTFVFKIVDFGKILSLVFWAFVDIWAAFFGIFYNFFMYIYYLFLFVIDRGSESTGTIGIRQSQKLSKIPSIDFEKTPSVIPSMYTKKSTPSMIGKTITTPTVQVAPKTTTTVGSTSSEKLSGTSTGTLVPLKPSYSSGGKKSIFKTIYEFIVEYITAIKNIIVKPFKFIFGLFSKKLQPVKEGEAKNVESAQGTGLIDQYLKEYEKKKR
ncbi:MAG: hypothetical protein FWH53_01515 [Leptospirales bacterium]|nr:hypothetical protein [Leptospirales bacterium]